MLSIYFSSYSVKYFAKNIQIMLKNFGRVCSRFSSTRNKETKKGKKRKMLMKHTMMNFYDNDSLKKVRKICVEHSKKRPNTTRILFQF